MIGLIQQKLDNLLGLDHLKLRYINQIFDTKECFWGLRGDPYLWENLKKEMSQIKIELTPDDFNKLLDEKFNDIIDNKGKVVLKDQVYFENYPQHGMTGGLVSLEWWKKTGLPLLKERYFNLKL